MQVWNTCVWHWSPQLYMELNKSVTMNGLRTYCSQFLKDRHQCSGMELQNGFTQYKKAAKHRRRLTDIDKSPIDETPQKDVLSLSSSLSLTQRCEKYPHYKANILAVSRAVNMKKTVRCMSYIFMQIHRSVIRGTLSSCSHQFYNVLIKT